MRLLVTGCGRSGTSWLAKCLRDAGIADAAHEKAFTVVRHGEDDWRCEVSWLAAPYTPLADAHVVHLVRHPLKVIASRVATQTFENRDRGADVDGRPRPRIGPWGLFAYDWCPGMHAARTPVERAAWHWVQWNRLVVADELLRVEDIDAATVTRLARIVDPDARGVDKLRLTAHRGDTPDPDPIDWPDIDHVPGLVAMAEAYGYGR